MNDATAAPVLVKQPFGAKRILLLVFGSLTVLVALALLASGAAAVWGLGERDETGFFASGTHELSTPSYALASESLDVGPDIPDWLGDGFVTVRVEADSQKPLFVGIGPAADVDRYLADVDHAQITDLDIDPFSVTSRVRDGTAQPAAPASENFWRARASGAGRQTITWPVTEGTWSVVVMNADGSRNVTVDARVGARISSLRWFIAGLFVVGAVVLVAGSYLVYLGARRPRLLHE